MFKKKTLKTCFVVAVALLIGMTGAWAEHFSKGKFKHRKKHKPVMVQILHTNDHHSYLDSSTYDLTLGGVATRLQMGGFTSLATLIKEERDKNTIVLNSGELNGTLYFSLFKGEPDFLVFNELGLDGYTLGNHEFDEGDERLAELIEMADFPILSSNMTPEEASPLYRVKDQIKPYVIKEIQGEKIGIIGILKVEKTKNSSMVSDDVTFTEEIEAANNAVAELEAQGINKIILVSHVGYYNDIVFAKNVPGLDVIVGGDTHSLLGNAEDLEAVGLAQKYSGQTGPFEGYTHDDVESEDLGSYPTTVIGPEGAPVHIVQAWSYAYGLGRLKVFFDAAGIAKFAKGNIQIPVAGPFLQVNSEGVRAEVSDETTQEINQIIDDSPILTHGQVDQTIDDILTPYRDEIEASMGVEIGTISETMGYDRIPTPFAVGDTPTGSYAAQVVCNAFKQTNPAIDFAIQNAGGVRTPLLEGPITMGDAIECLPFSNTVVMLDMTGAEIKRVLNEAAWYSLNSGSTGAFPYAAGLRYDVNLSGGEGEVIFNIEMLDEETGTWTVLDENAMFTVATNSFTALGKDNYLTFKDVRDADPTKFEDTYITYYIPLVEYIQGLPDQILPALDPDIYCLKSVQ
nr:5'-nucleotidase C-terminal domain-containing protein [uncultured Desulfobacter sp.]